MTPGAKWKPATGCLTSPAIKERPASVGPAWDGRSRRRFRHIEGMRTEAGQAPLADVFTVGGSTVVDVTARRVLGNGFGLEVGVRNLTDDVYIASARPAGLRPGMPRTLTGGFNLSF